MHAVGNRGDDLIDAFDGLLYPWPAPEDLGVGSVEAEIAQNIRGDVGIYATNRCSAPAFADHHYDLAVEAIAEQCADTYPHDD